ncbi:hypothetical protein Cni_G09437 [Canna indica]|uniref:DUF4005 domain-containing protein n=1 Tax=Canna indica TaxID=4628 RepID=A0AAQ3K405_9LILI|nr:hypothetical protein Cni_G09437 [Canna indica]
MGRATRWLRSLWGGKKDSKDSKDYGGYGGGGGGGEDRKEKKRWSFGKSTRDSGDVVLGQNAATAAAVEAAWLRSFCAESDREQSKHAIAVAAATAAAADAAVAAAQAAVAVVRLTNQGRGAAVYGSCHEQPATAAVKIQAAFRRYLAKKAFRALKALVKLQALVRGYLVRKQAAATLHSMQALIRAQAAVRAQRARSLLPNDRRFQIEFRPRRSLERLDETKSECMPSFHSRRLSACFDISSNTFDRSPKIVEVDNGRPRSRSSLRSNPSVSDPSDDLYSISMSSPLPSQIPARISIPECRTTQESEWWLGGEKGRLSVTAQSTPRCMNCSGDMVVDEDGVLRRFLNGPSCPSYMAKTQSFEAKLRSQSAPKQRPEPAGTRKRMPLSEVAVESMAAGFGRAGMQRSSSRAQEEAFSFKNAVVGKLDRSSEFYYLQRKW